MCTLLGILVSCVYKKAPSSTSPSLTVLNDLLTPCTIQKYVPYSYDKCSRSSDFFLMGHPHFVWLPKVWFILDSVHNSVYWLLEHHDLFPRLCARFMDLQILSGPQLKATLPRLTRDRGLTFSLLPIILQPFIRLINCLISSGGLPVIKSRNSKSSGNHN